MFSTLYNWIYSLSGTTSVLIDDNKNDVPEVKPLVINGILAEPSVVQLIGLGRNAPIITPKMYTLNHNDLLNARKALRRVSPEVKKSLFH